MVTSYRFALLAASASAALVLSACQQKVKEVEPVPTEEVVLPVTVPEVDIIDDIEVEDNLEEKEVVAEPEMTDILKDYTRAMSRMNDEMMIGMAYNDPDTAFAKSMLGHHRGAVDMAQIQLKYGTDTEMLKLARDIITTQQIEIDIMRRWLASHPDAAKPKPNTEVMQQAYADDMESIRADLMTGIADPVADLAFARGTLIHHVDAVDMALIQLKYGADEEMRKLALQIISEQQLEIELIENWLATRSTKSNNVTLLDDTSIDDATDNDSNDNELIKNEAEKVKKPTT